MRSTDRLSIDAEQLIPRVLKRGSFTVTTSDTLTSYVEGDNSVNEPSLSEIIVPSVDMFILLNSKFYRLPFTTLNGSNQIDLSARFSVSSLTLGGQDVIKLEAVIRKRGGSTSDVYTIYYIIYTTRVVEL